MVASARRSVPDAFGVQPDIMNIAKGLTNGAIPMGAVLASSKIYNCLMSMDQPEHMIELPHGYTYSAHPVACAATLAALNVFRMTTWWIAPKH